MDKKSSSGSLDVMRQARQLQDSAVTIIPIAFGSEANQQELSSITPNKDNVITSPDDEYDTITGGKIMMKAADGMLNYVNVLIPDIQFQLKIIFARSIYRALL